MRATSKRTLKPLERTPKPASGSGYHNCLNCPVCGTEDCKILQELGMYCETAVAAFEATRGEAQRRRETEAD